MRRNRKRNDRCWREDDADYDEEEEEKGKRGSGGEGEQLFRKN